MIPRSTGGLLKDALKREGLERGRGSALTGPARYESDELSVSCAVTVFMRGETPPVKHRAMRNAHGCAAHHAVFSYLLSWYCDVMNSEPSRNLRVDKQRERSPTTSTFNKENVERAVRYAPPVRPRKRYPSLSDDGQPYFPDLEKKIRAIITSIGVSIKERPVFLSVRAFALVAIVSIIAALAAAA